MKKYFILFVIAIGLAGCAGMEKKQADFDYRTAQDKNLATAMKYLEQNKIAAATDVLTKICSAKGVNGITDEALFRLALLYLKNDTGMAQQTLDRLVKEYPTSSWRAHATSLNELIASSNRKIRSLKGENASLSRENRELRLNIEKLRSLKGENISLSRENRELRLNIEKLKILDIEQELKHKR